MGVLTALLAADFGQLLGSDRTFTDQLGINLIVFPIAGIAFGAAVWSLTESKYRRWQLTVARQHTHAS